MSLCIMQVCEGTLPARLVCPRPLRISLGNSRRGRIGGGRLKVFLRRFGGGERRCASSGKAFYLDLGSFWAISDTVACLHGDCDILWNCRGRGIVCREAVIGFAKTPHASGETVQQTPGAD